MSRKVLIAGILVFIFAAIGFAVNYDIQKGYHRSGAGERTAGFYLVG